MIEPDIEVHAVDPDVDVVAVGFTVPESSPVVAVGQAPLLEGALLGLPLVGQPRDVGGGEAGGIIPEQSRQRLAEVAVDSPRR